jgi:general secretion pathway protein N
LAFEFDMSQFMPSRSEPKRRRRHADATRAFARGALTTAIILLLNSQSVRAEDGVEPLERHAAAIVNPVERQSLQSFAATLQRPLFAPSRRPTPPEPAPIVRTEEPPPPPPPPQPTIVLVGTMIDAAGPQAILRSGGDNKDLRVRVGDDVSGWKIRDIDQGHLTLALDDRTFSVALFPENSQPIQIREKEQSARPNRAVLHERKR